VNSEKAKELKCALENYNNLSGFAVNLERAIELIRVLEAEVGDEEALSIYITISGTTKRNGFNMCTAVITEFGVRAIDMGLKLEQAELNKQIARI